MGCGCGRGSVSSPMHNTATFAGVQTYTPEVYEVTYPDGRHEDFDSEADAYRAIRLTGGGVKRKPRP
jgi:hypothetical protein